MDWLMKRYLWSGIAGAAALVASLLIAGCGNWVDVRPDARDVAIIDAAQATNCKQLGESSASVLHDEGFVPRNPQAINADLVNIARNDAAKMGGNAVAPLHPRKRGHQMFGIYQCAQPVPTTTARGTTAPRNSSRHQPESTDGFQTVPYQPPT
jgi:hypothetical protein